MTDEEITPEKLTQWLTERRDECLWMSARIALPEDRKGHDSDARHFDAAIAMLAMAEAAYKESCEAIKEIGALRAADEKTIERLEAENTKLKKNLDLLTTLRDEDNGIIEALDVNNDRLEAENKALREACEAALSAIDKQRATDDAIPGPQWATETILRAALAPKPETAKGTL